MSVPSFRLAAASLLVLSTVAAQAAAPRYRIVDLGVVPATDASQAFGVSPDGDTAVGRALGDAGNPAITVTAATGAVALPNLPGRKYAAANAVNAAGVIVGTSTTTLFGSGALPVAWVNGVVQALPLPAGQTEGRATSVNASNVAAGSINSGSAETAALFAAGGSRIIKARTPEGSYMTSAFGINDAGLVVGVGIDPNNAALNVGTVYDAPTDTMTSVGALPGDNGALAFGVSNAGYVVGSSTLYQGGGRPFIWTAAGGMVEIPLPPKTSTGTAYAVNDRGWAVGNGGGLYSVPFLYLRGKTYPLANLIPAGSGWDLDHNTSSSAQGITDRGTIVGTAVHAGETHGYAMILVGDDTEMKGMR